MTSLTIQETMVKSKISHGLKGTVPAFPDPDCKNNAVTISTIHRFGGNVFANIAVRSGLQLTQTDCTKVAHVIIR